MPNSLQTVHFVATHDKETENKWVRVGRKAHWSHYFIMFIAVYVVNYRFTTAIRDY